MRALLNPKWLWLLNTLPVGLLLALFGAEYGVIRTLLSPESRQLWLVFGGVLLGLGVLHAAFAGWLVRRQQRLPMAYALVALGTYIGLLYAYVTQLHGLLPFNVPRWMVPADLPLYAGTFLMPTLAHAAAVLVVRLTPENRSHKALPSFGVALAVPLGWYLFVELVLPFWHMGWWWAGEHVMVVLLIAGTLIFLLALSRGVYIMAQRRTAAWARYRWVGVLLVAGVLPLLGLAVNNGLFFPYEKHIWHSESGLFGNFTEPWWYGLAVLNAVLLLWPDPLNSRGRLALFLGRGVLLSYTLYFFLVFLPFLPLALVAVAAAGVGFLLLTPLVLFIVHLRMLAQDYAALRPVFGRRGLVLGLVAAVAILPAVLTAQYAHDRAVLHQALDYVYAPDYHHPPVPLDTTTLNSTLRTVRYHKEGRGNSITGAQLPYLSMFYNWLVLDNLMLPEGKLAMLESIFSGSRAELSRSISADPVAVSPASAVAEMRSGPRLTKLTARSHYDARQQAWVSWVDLTIINADSTFRTAEYATELELPAGCFVSNYYLDMAGRREFGILAEKRAATWVYQQIRNENHDPGLLRYRNGNRLELRVFPFSGGEVRRTGLELLHREPLTLHLDGQSVALGAARSGTEAATEVQGEGVTYLSAARKATLPVVARRPYYHFLVDMSAGSQRSWPRYRRQMRNLLRENSPAAQAPEFSLIGADVRQLTERDMLRLDTTALHFGGGFYLDRAIRQALVRAADQPEPRYPVLVVVSADFDRAILPDNFADLRHAFPETDQFYELLDDGRLVAHSLLTNPARRGATLTAPEAAGPVLAWPTAGQPAAYLPANGQPDIVLTAPAGAEPPALQPHDWRSGLALQGRYRAQLHHPETSETAGRQLVEASFHTGLLTPLTAYLALENDAQKAALRRKQTQLLAGHAGLEATDDEQRMSEPGDWLLLALLAAGLAWQHHHRQSRRLSTCAQASAGV